MREFGSEFPLAFEKDCYLDRIQRKIINCVYLQSGRQGLRMIADELNATSKNILMPAYCCNSMVKPFKDSGWNVAFYPINVDLNLDIMAVANLLSQMPKDSSVLLMNYFGISDVKTAIKSLRGLPNGGSINLIYDFTHCLLSFDDVYDPDIDYYAASIRKWIGVNSGAIILSKHKFLLENCVCQKINDFVEKRLNAQNNKFLYETTKDEHLKAQFRNIFRDAEVYLDQHTEYYKIDDRSFNVLKNNNFIMMGNSRFNNIHHLFELIKNNNKIEFIKSFNAKIYSHSCKFMLPILIDNRDIYQRLMALKGLYTQLLWPLLDEARSICPIAVDMENRMCAIPIDQRFSYEDIEDIGNIINSVIK